MIEYNTILGGDVYLVFYRVFPASLMEGEREERGEKTRNLPPEMSKSTS